eukprot:Selendium_serpulae@DN6929_c0_g1_i1.p1
MADVAAELDDLQEAYRRRQVGLVHKALSVAGTYWPLLERLASVLATTDILCGFALVAACATKPYCRPKVVERGQQLLLKASRHPLLEMRGALSTSAAGRTGRAAFIPNDVRMTRPPIVTRVSENEKKNEEKNEENKNEENKNDETNNKNSDAKEKSNSMQDAGDSPANQRRAASGGADGGADNFGHFHVITGPNMGGKSTYIRQVALCVLMAQMGCFVPCDEATIPVVSHIMCRIGASDVQLKGISTFFAEMNEASAILASASPSALVIVDELGRGTSTYEGFGLAWAIARHLAVSTKCLSLFATHFHEMGALETEIPGVVNLHVASAFKSPTSTLSQSGLSQSVEGKKDDEPSTAIVESQSADRNRGLAFLYTVRPGVANQSYGVHVAELAGIPQRVLVRAREKTAELEIVERSHCRALRDGAPDDDAGRSCSTDLEQTKTLMRDLFAGGTESEFEARCRAAEADIARLGSVVS